MAQSFSDTIKRFEIKAAEAVEAVFKQSLQDLDEAVKKRTPVDTGFLRNSWMASTVSLPALTRGADGTSGTPPNNGGAIAAAEFGKNFYFGFTAVYAPHLEYGARGRSGNRMVGLAVQKWPSFVEQNARTAKRVYGL